MRIRSHLILLSLGLWMPGRLCAESNDPSGSMSRTKFSGYADLLVAFADFGADPKASSRGSKQDQRWMFDTSRFTLELERKLTRGFLFEAELEIEHGGTGAAQELEYEEGGEYEIEVEKAGEVQFEELFLQKQFDWGRLRVGRFPVAFGMLPLYHHPFDYLGTVRAESEEHLIPSGWSEIGAEFMVQGYRQMLHGQFINGLDSSGFSSPYFIREGQQNMFETNKANNPALVLRWTNYDIPGLETGLSAYYGDSSANRPQADLTNPCEGQSDAQKVAPCGYVKTPLTLLSWFARGQWDRIQGQASVVHGQIQRADEINRRNIGLSKNFQGVLRSPVGKEAYSAWTEWGYRLDGLEPEDVFVPFFRWEAYDTVWKAAQGQLDQPRYAQHVVTVGASYQIESALNFKIDALQRSFGSSRLRTEHEYRLALAFVY